MFIGHFAVGFAAKKVSPAVSLGTLFIAVQFIDLLWPLFLLMGVEHVRIDPGNTAFTPLEFYSYPYTHSLLGAMFWGCLLGGAYYAIKRNRSAALLVAGAVFSHWVLDFLSHRPDLPLYPGSSTFLGLGLWNSVPATIAVEGILFGAAVLLYARLTRPKTKAGSWGLWTLVAFLIIIYFANVFGPPPPEVSAIAYVGLSLWLFAPWLYWIDRNREYKSSVPA